MTDTAVLTCVTAGCGRPATRHHRWRRTIQVERIGPRGGRKREWAAEGDWIEADYCEVCSEKFKASDEEVTPPWPVASITSIDQPVSSRERLVAARSRRQRAPIAPAVQRRAGSSCD